MQNPIAKLVPQYFGEYPKPFQKLFKVSQLAPSKTGRSKILIMESI